MIRFRINIPNTRSRGFKTVRKTRAREGDAAAKEMSRTNKLRLALLLVLTTFNPSAAALGDANSNIQSSASRSTKGLNHAVGPSAESNTINNLPARFNETTRSICGPPSYKCSYDGTDAKPLCTNCDFPEVPDMSAEPNAVSYDKVFGMMGEGNQIVRCTYPNTHTNNSHLFGIGFGGSGDTNAISKGGGYPFSYRLIIGDSDGWAYPFTYTPDPVHPKCQPTYPLGSFTVTEGSFSWLIPHLYFAFGGYHFKVNAIDLGSVRLPERRPIADFQQILPRDGPDWPGPSQTVALGAIIRPLANNAGNFLYQATCAPRRTSCSPGPTGGTHPRFSQIVMTDSGDGGVVWRNIGIGFKGAATWYAVGGVSTDDDVFVKSFSDEGGQGGPGAIFVAVYIRSSNVYYLYNVGTGIISYSNCKGGTGYDCSGGSWTQRIVGMTGLPDRYLLHNVKISKNGKWLLLELDSCSFQTCSIIPGGPGMFVWQLSTTSTRVSKITVHPWGHWTTGFDLLVNQGDDTGVNLEGRSFAAPGSPFSLNYFSLLLPASAGLEVHPSWNYNDGSDTTPVCTATSGFAWPYTVPWENEVICYGTNPNADCSAAGHGACRNQTKRFFHTYNPATCDQNDGFNGCWGIGALSQDGRYYAFTSNWGDTLGSTSKGGHGPGSCTGAFNFQMNHFYQAGDLFEPGNATGNGHPNAGFNVFKVTVAGSSAAYPPHAWPRAWLPKHNAEQGFYANGTTILPLTFPNNPCNHRFQVTTGRGAPNGSKPPTWKEAYGYSGSCSSVTVGARLTDGGITWTDMGEYVLGTMHLANLGRDDCRSDVFIGVLN